MKIKITEPDCNGHEIGDIVDVKGNEIPGWAVNKAVETDEKPSRGKRVAVTNPAKGADANPDDEGGDETDGDGGTE